MGTRLVQGGWEKELKKAIAADGSLVRIVSPFIKKGAVETLFSEVEPQELRVITRFNLDHFSEGVSDVSALRELLQMGARIRGVRRLHAKLYMFGEERVVITSANLTEAGMAKNHELGIVADGGELASGCGDYFEKLWEGSGPDLAASRLAEWEEQIAAAQIAAGPSQSTGLGDEGADLGAVSELQLPPWFDEPRQAFVKFFGKSDNRAARDYSIFEELKRGGSHWACTYPKGKRPRAPRDGAVMFMGRLVHSPDDTLIYGRAIGIRYQDGRDDASPEDIAVRPWKKQWPHYIRVHDPEFLAGTMQNGVPLSELMDELGAHAFGSTAENADSGYGNTNPRHAIRQMPSVRLAPAGLSWLNDQLELAFEQHGKLPPAQLASLDWPEV